MQYDIRVLLVPSRALKFGDISIAGTLAALASYAGFLFWLCSLKLCSFLACS